MQHTAIPNTTHSSKGGFSLMTFGIPFKKSIPPTAQQFNQFLTESRRLASSPR